MPTHLEHDGCDLTDAPTAADRALVDLRRTRLIRSWQRHVASGDPDCDTDSPASRHM